MIDSMVNTIYTLQLFSTGLLTTFVLLSVILTIFVLLSVLLTNFVL